MRARHAVVPIIPLLAAAVAAVVGSSRRASVAQSLEDEICPISGAPTTHEGGDLEGFARERGDGVVYDDEASHLELNRSGGEFQGTIAALQDEFNASTAADFDGDGWTDFVVASTDTRFIRFYKNRTFESPAPDWDDPDDIRTPKFVRTHDIEPATGQNSHANVVAGDFDQDGDADFFYYRNEGADHSRLELARIYLGNGDGTFQEPYEPTDDLADFGYYTWIARNSIVTDWNGNGWPDILFGTKLGTSDDDGAIIAFLNDCPDVATDPPQPCSTAPKFEPQILLEDLNFGFRGPAALALEDFTNDGEPDLVAGSPSYDGLRLYPGLPGGGFDEDYEDLDSVGAATETLAADFTLDGRTDLIYGTDNFNYGNGLGGRTFFYENDGTGTPFSDGVTQELSTPSHVGDFDTGVVLDYDRDPDRTLDFMIADGNHSGSFFIFANRVIEGYVECGEVASGILDLGDLEDEEMVITSGRLAPEMSLPSGTSVDFFMANQTPPNWTQASPCPDAPDEYCVSFDEPTSADLQWKAVMCSDESRQRTPSIEGVEVNYDYSLARTHYRAGVVVRDGVVYAAGFSQPGARGHVVALDAELTTTYWDAGETLDDMENGERHIYTSTSGGRDQLAFADWNADDAELQATLAVANEGKAEDVIAWARSARFGLQTQSRLGAIETSTPAVLTPPTRPAWYPSLSPEDREDVDDFLDEHSDRPTLVLVSSRSGMLHAFQSDPDSINAGAGGREAWAFVPARVAAEMESDMTSGEISAYPDGSPTLADIRDEDGDMMTVAVVSGGKGSRGVFALDVTDTADPDTGTVRGPEPLWHAVPGSADAGRSRTSPVIIRTDIDDDERFLAVMGSGPAPHDLNPPYSRGRQVLAVDAATGEEIWKFRAACALTSDLSAFTTADTTGTAEGDEERDASGFMDRVVFADACGNVYMLDPGQDLGGGYASSGDLNRVDTGAVGPGGEPVYALFSTTETEGALESERPIAGTIGARPDASGRTVLFFGTGGLASADPTLQNAFYAVYADTGEIRNALEGRCLPEGCEKFYGGVVVTGSQVFVTRAVDPPTGSDLCSEGQSRLQALDLNTLSVGFSVDIEGRSVSPLFGHDGAVYLTTESGAVTRVGEPATPAPGGGDDDGPGATGAPVPTEVMAWRRLF